MSESDVSIDFKALFEGIPGLFVCLNTDADFRILTLTDAYCAATRVVRSEVCGRGMFEVFTDNPDNPEATGVRKLRFSLEQCLRTRKPHVMAVQKYDIRREDGTFEERYWTPTNSPVLDPKDPQVRENERTEVRRQINCVIIYSTREFLRRTRVSRGGLFVFFCFFF